MLRVSVLSGPDRGLVKVFQAQRVSIGDDPQNDLKLNDQLVSRFHGALEVLPNQQLVYHDLGSRNGTVIVSGDTRHQLHDRQRHQSAQLANRARVALGQTVIDVEFTAIVAPKGATGPSLPGPSGAGAAAGAAAAGATAAGATAALTAGDATSGPASGATSSVSSSDGVRLATSPRLSSRPTNELPSLSGIARRNIERPETLTQRLSKHSDQLQVVFRLARELNSLTKIEDILERVVQATFEMFPLANFFAICVENAENTSEMLPSFLRTRSGVAMEPMLSQSLLRDVIRGREAIMYVRDAAQRTDTRNSIMLAQITACLAAPLIGQHKLMGVMQLDSRGCSGMFGPEDLDLFTLLASSAAFAMERSELTRDIYQMFEAFVQASVAAIDARDPTTAGHSHRVAQYTLLLAEAVNTHRIERGPLSGVRFKADELTELRYAALLHDFGKIGVREATLQKASRLTPERLELLLQRLETMRAQHHVQALTAHLARLAGMGAITRADVTLTAQAQTPFERYARTLKSLQNPRPLTADDIQCIEEMARLSFVLPSGATVRFLDDEDIQNLSIPSGTLNDAERRHIESHAGLSRDYLSKIPWRAELSRIPCIAGDHHEKLDGSGYPKGLQAPAISPQVRILTICDIFDALTAKDRPYKRSRSIDESCAILGQEASSGKLDSNLLELFVQRVVPQIAPMLRDS